MAALLLMQPCVIIFQGGYIFMQFIKESNFLSGNGNFEKSN